MVEQRGLENGSPPAGLVQGQGRCEGPGAKPPEAIGTMKYCVSGPFLLLELRGTI